MACQKSLDFAAPPGTDAHLSYYWTMNEAGDLDKVDSAVGYSWDTAVGTSSPAGLFSNGIQLDVTPAAPPHGLNNIGSTGLAFNAATSTGVSAWLWTKQVANSSGTIVNPFIELFVRCGSVFVDHADFDIKWGLIAPPALATFIVDHHDSTAGNDYQVLAAFTPVLGAWHMLAGTIDFVNNTLNAYVDGVLVGTSADVGSFYTATDGDLELVYAFGGGVNTGNVVVDELGISLKGALTPAQVLALYNGGAGMTWPAITAVVPYP